MVLHRWHMTVRQFVETVRRDYGIEIAEAAVGLVAGRALHREGRSIVLLVDEDEILSPSVLRSLCRFYRLDPLDFGLDPEED